jgi:hypothetical protein
MMLAESFSLWNVHHPILKQKLKHNISAKIAFLIQPNRLGASLTLLPEVGHKPHPSNIIF